MYSKMNGYPLSFRSSGGRLWGMSHSLPSGMSNYAYGQDSDFSYSPRSRMYDMPSSSTFGNAPNTSSSSTSSLSGLNFGPGGNNQIGTNLIVNYLPQDMSERELYSMFSTMGPIESCRVMRDFKTGYSYGFGFINFLTEEAAQRAIRCLNGYRVRNKRLKVSYARPHGEDIKETNLYITNLPRTITEEQLDIIFGKYGTIVQKNILRDKLTGQPKGVAFVRFSKREEAQEAISALNNVIPQGGIQPLNVRIAEDHGRAKAALYVPSYNSIVHNNRAILPQQNSLKYSDRSSGLLKSHHSLIFY
ncbi:protein sex-lethal isoform X2 [Toxorhynchites rutilus septentrionalis]|uniref:protein sex-lethal isoform X2 n=1 Tax=Toxorhynchites rutilus septentrionalis TaxID=329112 RepID=UPI002479250A|nr:protein sex-lethal isoform X2 [Toxorhynchites rutilus septentrionalis]